MNTTATLSAPAMCASYSRTPLLSTARRGFVAEQAFHEQGVGGDGESPHGGKSEREIDAREDALDEAHEALGRALARAAVEQPPQDDAEVREVEQAPERACELRRGRILGALESLREYRLHARAGERRALGEHALVGATEKRGHEGAHRLAMGAECGEAQLERAHEAIAPAAGGQRAGLVREPLRE